MEARAAGSGAAARPRPLRIPRHRQDCMQAVSSRCASCRSPRSQCLTISGPTCTTAGGLAGECVDGACRVRASGGPPVAAPGILHGSAQRQLRPPFERPPNAPHPPPLLSPLPPSATAHRLQRTGRCRLCAVLHLSAQWPVRGNHWAGLHGRRRQGRAVRRRRVRAEGLQQPGQPGVRLLPDLRGQWRLCQPGGQRGLHHHRRPGWAVRGWRRVPGERAVLRLAAALPLPHGPRLRPHLAPSLHTLPPPQPTGCNAVNTCNSCQARLTWGPTRA